MRASGETKITQNTKPMVTSSRRKQVVFSLILFLLVSGIIEMLTGLSTFFLSRRWGIPYIPALSDEQINAYLKERSLQLGWGAATDASGKVLSLRPRSDPTSPRSQAPCVSAYGDSFTFGSGVSDDATYPHYLAVHMRCPVANFGVGGYGSDQALMLFRSQSTLDRAPMVILGHLSENILRNINQYRNLLYLDSEFGFKPRYLLEGNQLRYVPIQINSPDDFLLLKEHPEAMLPFDAFIDRPRLSFPYSIALLRFFITDFHVRTRIAGIPWYAPFYRPDHPAMGLQLTTRILASFVDEAHVQGKTAFVLLIPTGLDLLYAKKTDTWTYQPLKDALAREGITVIDAGPKMLSRLKGTDPCHIFQNCHSHFNEIGNKMLADVVAEEIEKTRKRP